jgi:hypothetical protein
MSSIFDLIHKLAPLQIRMQGRLESFSIEGITDDAETLSKEGQALVERLQVVQLQI